MRVFLSIAVAMLAAIGIGCGSQTFSRGIQIDRSFRNLIWPEATVLAGADIQALQKTGFYKRYSQQLDLSFLNQSTGQLGFDPRRDVKTLLLQSDSRRSLLLAEGTLKASEIRQKLSAMGANSTTYRSYQLLGDERNSLVLLGNSMAVGGSAQAVRSALDVRENKTGSLPADLQARLESIENGSQIWIVSSRGLPFAEMPMRSDVRSALSNIVSYISGTTAALQVDTGLKLDARITCISQAGAQRVHDALRGGIGLARLSTKDDQVELLRIYDAIDVSQTGTLVEIKAALNAGEVDKLMTYLPQIKSQAGHLAQ